MARIRLLGQQIRHARVEVVLQVIQNKRIQGQRSRGQGR